MYSIRVINLLLCDTITYLKKQFGRRTNYNSYLSSWNNKSPTIQHLYINNGLIIYSGTANRKRKNQFYLTRKEKKCTFMIYWYRILYRSTKEVCKWRKSKTPYQTPSRWRINLKSWKRGRIFSSCHMIHIVRWTIYRISYTSCGICEVWSNIKFST